MPRPFRSYTLAASLAPRPPARTSRPLVFALVGALTGFAGAGPQGLEASQGTDTLRAPGVRDPNGHPFRTPAASTLEPVYRLAIIRTSLETEEVGIALAADPPGRARSGAPPSASRASAHDDFSGMAIVELGDRFGFWIRRAPRSGFELAGAFHVGASSRFSLAGPNQDLLGIHYRAGFLLRARLGGIAARAELYHVSSHLGDEIHESSGRDPIETTREGLEVLLQAAPFRGAVLYGGPGLLLRSREFETLSVRVGAEWEGGGPEADVRPYFSGEGFLWAEHDWDPSLALEAGAALGRIARIGVLFGTGPTRLEQFMGEGETLFGVSLSLRRG